MDFAKNRDVSFFEKVYAVVREIPFGRVTSYGAIAKYLGSAQSSRMVGWAMNYSHATSIYVPAHRVVNRIGLLTGKRYFGDNDAMKQLLEGEGLKIENDMIVGFNSFFWDPAKELKL